MPFTGNAEDVGRRIRAALALAGKTSADVAPELNVSARTLDRVVAGIRMPREWELQRLAEILDVPEWFLRSGFAGAPQPDTGSSDALREAADRHALEHDQVMRRFDELGEQLRLLTLQVGDRDRSRP